MSFRVHRQTHTYRVTGVLYSRGLSGTIIIHLHTFVENLTEDAVEKEEDSQSKGSQKFHWETVMIEVLDKADGKEISIKKLRKKVVIVMLETPIFIL